MEFVQPILWKEDTLYILNQLKLPEVTEYNTKKTIQEVFHAVKDMELRGAPLIGITAAYGMYIGIKDTSSDDHQSFMELVKESAEYLRQSRPTAVNLFWAIDRMVNKASQLADRSLEEKKHLLLEEAIEIQKEDESINRSIGENFMPLLRDGIRILTHCNAGSLATAKYGTATAPMYIAKEKGWAMKVYADETRPYLQGARLTSYELHQAEIDVTLICDNMAGFLMSQGKVDVVIVGADRVAANGDTANKIGTMSLAVLANHFKIPFYVAVPTPSLDLATPTGKEIPIEERSPLEITNWYGKQIAPEGVTVYNPAFDITPHGLITAFVTEKGIVLPDYQINLQKLLAKK